MSRQNRAYLFAITTILFWSTVATAFKVSLRYLDIFQLLFYACLTSATVLVAAVLIQRKGMVLLEDARRHWKTTLLAGALNPCIYYLVLFEAYDRLLAQIAQPINYTWSITLSLMSMVFLRQKLLRSDIISALVCYTGVVVIATGGKMDGLSTADPAGIALALVSTVVWAGYWILNIRDPREPVSGMCLNFLVALPVTFVLCLAFSGFAADPAGLAGAVYVGVFEMSLAFLFWSFALRLSSNTARVSNLIFLSPFLSLLFISRILGETIALTTWTGLSVIVAALLYQQWAHMRLRRAGP